MIDHNSLTTNTPTNASQRSPQLVNEQVEAVVQDLLRPFVEDLGKVREELGGERTRREQAERERDELRRELEEVRARVKPWWRRMFGS
jgi:hypothetical protein